MSSRTVAETRLRYLYRARLLLYRAKMYLELIARSFPARTSREADIKWEWERFIENLEEKVIAWVEKKILEMEEELREAGEQ